MLEGKRCLKENLGLCRGRERRFVILHAPSFYIIRLDFSLPKTVKYSDGYLLPYILLLESQYIIFSQVRVSSANDV